MQITFGMMEDQSRRQKRTMLDEVVEIIDFRKITELLQGMYNGKTGRPHIPPLMLFKAMLLESWYGLSDVEVVQEIHDRRSFERFVGEEVRRYYLDDTTLVKFRERLRDSRVMKRVWDEVDRALIQKGLVVKQGAIVDTTLVRGHAEQAPDAKTPHGWMRRLVVRYGGRWLIQDISCMSAWTREAGSSARWRSAVLLSLCIGGITKTGGGSGEKDRNEAVVIREFLF